MRRRSGRAAIGLAILCGCSGDNQPNQINGPVAHADGGQPDASAKPANGTLSPGSPVLVAAREVVMENVSATEVKGGKVSVMFTTTDPPIGWVADGTRAIVVEDEGDKSPYGESRGVTVRIDEGEFKGKVGDVVRYCLVEVKGPE